MINVIFCFLASCNARQTLTILRAKFYSGYGETADFDPSGGGPNQWMIRSEGNEYLQSSYPKLSYFSKVQFK